MLGLPLATLAAWIVGSTSAFPSDGALRFSHLTSDDGLSRNWVRTTLRDHRGFLWIGTQHGLNRYDGRRFVVYRHVADDPNSLPSSLVQALLEDSRGRLWVGSGSGQAGLAIYDRELDHFVRLPYGLGSGGLASSWAYTIYEDSQNRIWVGTDGFLERVYHEAGAIEVESHPLPLDDPQLRLANAIREDRAGMLWVGTESGLLRFDPVTRRFMEWSGGDGRDAMLREANVHDLLDAGDGTLWVAAVGAGLFRLDPERGVIEHHVPRPGDPTSISHLRTRRLARDGDGRIWVGTENGGVSVLDPETGRFTRHTPDPSDADSLSSASIWSLDIDDQGIVWIGTYNGGLDYVAPYATRFRLLTARRGQLSNDHVTAILQDRRGDLWIATDGGGVNRIDTRTDVTSELAAILRVPGLLGRRFGERGGADLDRIRLIGGGDRRPRVVQLRKSRRRECTGRRQNGRPETAPSCGHRSQTHHHGCLAASWGLAGSCRKPVRYSHPRARIEKKGPPRHLDSLTIGLLLLGHGCCLLKWTPLLRPAAKVVLLTCSILKGSRKHEEGPHEAQPSVHGQGRALMGHRCLSTTERYLHVAGE